MSSSARKIVVLAVLIVAIATAVALRQGRGPTSQVAASPESPATASSAPANGVPRLLELGSETCIPCKAMQPVLAELRATYPGRLQVDFVDVRKQREVAERYAIEAIPTQIFFDSKGKERFRHVGFFSKDEIVTQFKAMGELQ